MAKGLGNGVPIAAVTTTRAIAESLLGKVHFNTFGGNPVSSATAIGVMELIDKENMQANC